jgi:hypothetical protein
MNRKIIATRRVGLKDQEFVTTTLGRLVDTVNSTTGQKRASGKYQLRFERIVGDSYKAVSGLSR